MLFTRYLIEDNSNDYVIFDKDAECNIKTVSSRFKFIIGKYDLLPEDKELEYHTALVNVIYILLF